MASKTFFSKTLFDLIDENIAYPFDADFFMSRYGDYVYPEYNVAIANGHLIFYDYNVNAIFLFNSTYCNKTLIEVSDNTFELIRRNEPQIFTLTDVRTER